MSEAALPAPGAPHPKPGLSEKAKLQILIATISGGVAIVVAVITALGTILASENRITSLWSKFGQISAPIGTIMAYAGPMDEDRKKELDRLGWLPCDGTLVPMGPKYEALAKLLGRIWGPGNNSDRVSLPNLQGLFLRGVDPTGVNDGDFQRRTNYQGSVVGPVVGSLQSDAIKIHTHTMQGGFFNGFGGGGGSGFGGAGSGGHTDGNIEGGLETRPKNVYVFYIIKF